MKALTPIIVLALAVSFAAPVSAAKHVSRSAENKGVTSDIPRNHTDCKKIGGSWNDQTLTCSEKGKM